jgi:hypothetical protein
MAVVEVGAKIRVLYALPDEQVMVDLDFEPGMTAATAIAQSGFVERYPQISGHELVPGIWGVEVVPEFELRAGDRVEISRPLVADPREMRREFLNGGRVMGGASAPDAQLRKKG